MSSEAIQIVNIDISKPLVEQQSLQLFLGHPSIEEEAGIVDSDLMYKFLQIIHQTFKEEVTHYLSDRAVNGIKFGYERKVPVLNNSYRVDSQFVTDENWPTDFALGLNDQIHFSTASDRNSEEVELIDHQLKSYLANLNEACADEIHRIYPRLKYCLEIQFHTLVNLESEESSSDWQSMDWSNNEDNNSNALSRSILLASNCPGCWEDTIGGTWNKNKKGSPGNCETCPRT
jgi:hypothetical protein